MKKIKGGEVNRCLHDQCLTWDTDTEYGEWVKCVSCGTEMPKGNWLLILSMRNKKHENGLVKWLKNIDPMSIDAGLVYFVVYILVMLAYAYYSL